MNLKRKTNKFYSFWTIFIFCLFLIFYGHFLNQQKDNLLIGADVKINNFPVDISAVSYLVGEINSGKLLAKKNSDLHLFPASLSKLMAAVIVSENFSLDEEIIVSPDKSKTWEDEPPEDIKKEKNKKKILENKKLQESLKNDSMVGYIILESIINSEDIYLLNKYSLQEGIINDIWNGLNVVIDSVKGLINKASSNYNDISERFSKVGGLIQKKMGVDSKESEYIEQQLKTKIENLSPDKKDIFTTNLILLNNSEQSIKNGAADYIINNGMKKGKININDIVFKHNKSMSLVIMLKN
jgi:hypothetical protein